MRLRRKNPAVPPANVDETLPVLTEAQIRQIVLNNPPKGLLVLTRRQRWWRLGSLIVSMILVFWIGVLSAIWLEMHPNAPLVGPVQRFVVDAGPVPGDVQPEFTALGQAYRAITQSFYGRLDGKPVDHKALVYAAGDGMAQSLGDPFSLYRPPDVAKTDDAHITGKTVGIGVTLKIQPGGIVLVRVVAGGPADKAGLKKGDMLLKADVTALDNLVATTENYDKVTAVLRGDAGTTLTVTVRHADGSTQVVTITRGEFITPSVDSALIDNGQVGYISMRDVFGNNTASELDAALADLKKQGGANVRGYILDLRGDHGGLVNSAEEVLGRFLPANSTAFIEDHKHGPEGQIVQKVSNTTNAPTLLDAPLVVLVDKDSASASEIVAGALRDSRHAPLVGATTYGKGSEQSIFTLVDGSTMRVTIAHWLTPAKTDIYGKGLAPDISVAAGPNDIPGDPATDAQLVAGLQKLHDLIAAPAPKAATPTGLDNTSAPPPLPNTIQAITLDGLPQSGWL